MEVEYTICQIQSGQISLAAKTHRRLGGNPRLQIHTAKTAVNWRLFNLIDGTPETLVGVPRQNHIDFYFLWDNIQLLKSSLPSPTARPNTGLRLPPLSSAGTERPGGIHIKLLVPVHRYPLESLQLFVAQQPSFKALGTSPYLHMDVESAPQKIYSRRDIFEIHFGIQADFNITGKYNGASSDVIFTMLPEVYANLYSDVQALR
jgi:hypothetical protein